MEGGLEGLKGVMEGVSEGLMDVFGLEGVLEGLEGVVEAAA